LLHEIEDDRRMLNTSVIKNQCFNRGIAQNLFNIV